MKISIKLLLMTSLQFSQKGPKKLAAVLRRPEFNWKTLCPVSYPGASHFTIQGDFDDGGVPIEIALYSAICEGFGRASADMLLTESKITAGITLIYGTESDNEIILYYAMGVPPAKLAALWPNGGPRPILHDDLRDIQALPNCNADPEQGVFAWSAIHTTLGDKNALKRAFEIFENQEPDAEVGFNDDEQHRLAFMRHLVKDTI